MRVPKRQATASAAGLYEITDLADPNFGRTAGYERAKFARLVPEHADEMNAPWAAKAKAAYYAERARAMARTPQA